MTNPTIPPAEDSDSVLIIGAVAQRSEGFVEHGPADRITRTVGEMKESYRRIVGQIVAMAEGSPQSETLSLSSIEVGLGFTAEGELGLVAKATAGVEATITLTFKKEA